MRYADLLLAEEQTGSPVPVDEFTFSAAGGDGYFVVGENRSGVRSAEQMLADYAPLNKVDSARRCGLYFGRLEKQPVFDADKFWGEYSVDGLTVKTLPGVFSRDGLDVDSQLLLSTLTPHTKGKVLDVGCGAGCFQLPLRAIRRKFVSPCAMSLRQR